uniref:Glycosyltransferase n=1 Tax=Desulfacinum infernum TaxID=35837 RepID=A0A832A6S7_9BACT
MAEPRLSLCMIVKNEEKNLPRCLESVQGQVDEIVVVDTGSTDGTREVAARYGAKVLTYRWQNDFSAARNVSLDHASGDWVLWLDADEELLDSSQGVTLRQLAAVSDMDGYLMPIQNMKLDGTFTAHYAVRFFRKLDGIHFEGKAHESVGDWLLRYGGRIERSPVAIRHWGYAITEERLQEKLDRNLELLMAQVEKDPNNSYAHYYVGMSLMAKKNFEGGYRHLKKAQELGPTTPNMECLVLNMLAYYHLHHGNHRTAEELTRRSLSITPRQHTGRLFLGIALYNQKKYREALPLLREAYQFQRLPLDRRRSDLSLEHAYGEAELLWAVARSAYEVGNFPLAYQFAQRLQEAGGTDGSVLVLQAASSLALGAFQEAAIFFQKAQDMGASWVHIAAPWIFALLHLGRLDEARDLLEKAGSGFFENGESEKTFPLFVERHWEAGEMAELIQTLTRLAAMDHVPLAVLDALALSLIKQQRYTEAVPVLEKMLHDDPGNPQIQRRLAAVYARLGHGARAAELLNAGGAGSLSGNVSNRSSGKNG